MPGYPLWRPCAALFSLLFMLAAGPAAADALDDALRSGNVDETPRGYIAPVTAPSPAITGITGITGIVNDINQRRRNKYREIARKTNMTLGQIEAFAGKRIIERAAAGTYYKDLQGTWRRK
jgi:uncharacterized protein YdbL (DUF1318 family)